MREPRKYLVTFEDGNELLVETEWGEEDAVKLAQRHWRDWEPFKARPVKAIHQVWTDEVPPQPEGCEWWRYEPVRERHPFSATGFEKWVPVCQDWCPSFWGNYVYVRIDRREPRYLRDGNLREGMVRVTLWGGDDIGMEKEYPLDALDEALADYNWIEIGVTFADLAARGFVGA